MTTNADFSNVDTGAFVAEDGHNFIISARVGGANEDLFIDNLVITVDGTDDADRDGLPDYVHTYPRDKTGDNYTIPDGVTSIGDWAFVDCESLTDITFRGNAPTLGGGNVFLRVPANAKVFIYEGASGFGGRFGGFSVVVQKNPFAGDTDKDGWKDETEVLFGSSPDNAKSVPAFKLKMNVLEGDQLELLFPGEEGARYSVQTSDDMKTWLSLEKLIIGQGDTISERFSISGGLGFYRIREEQ